MHVHTHVRARVQVHLQDHVLAVKIRCVTSDIRRYLGRTSENPIRSTEMRRHRFDVLALLILEVLLMGFAISAAALNEPAVAATASAACVGLARHIVRYIGSRRPRSQRRPGRHRPPTTTT